MRDAKNFWKTDKANRRKSVASISSSHIIDLALDDNMSSSVEYQRFSTLGRKRNSIDRHSAAMFGAEDEVRIKHAIVFSVMGLSFHLNSI